MYLIRVLSFIGDLTFNVRGKHVPDGWGGVARGFGGYQPGVYVPLKTHFLVINVKIKINLI